MMQCMSSYDFLSHGNSATIWFHNMPFNMYCKIGARIDEWAMQTMDKGLRANKLNENRKPIN